LRLLASASICGLTLSRLATDLLVWTTTEFGFLHLPDELTGSSSAMPQKKNPFLLEHVQGRSASLTAAFMHAAGATHATPFTNSIAVGTEAVKPLWGPLQDLTDMVVLMRLVVSAAQPNETAMRKSAVQGFTAATALANQLVIRAKLDFRTAHKLIGSAVRKAAESSGEPFESGIYSSLAGQGIPISITDLDPASLQRSQEFGGGPGPTSLKLCLNQLRSQWGTQNTKKNALKKKWQAAALALERVVREYTTATEGDSLLRFHNGLSNGKARTIELRSDTFTLPSSQMIDAIAVAGLGDDGYREDPTVIHLEELAAAKLGKEAACLTPSGTMANLAAILAHCKKGSRVLVGDQSDIYAYEDQGLAEDAGVILSPVTTAPDGTLLLSRLEDEFGKAGSAPVDLVCLENPHNLCGGVVLPLSYLRDAAALVHKKGALLHLDGARLFHAAVRLGCDPAEIARDADSVQICLSKGLAAPVGSIVAGNAEFIERVRTKRQMLGGNMRQAGIIAAPGIIALRHMVERLADDHANARRFAEGLARIPGIEVDLNTVQTNTVVFRVVDPRFTTAGFIAAVAQFGLNVSDFRYGRLRAVFHYGVEQADVDLALSIIAGVMETRSEYEPLLQEAQAHG
jgi:threonine aldolase